MAPDSSALSGLSQALKKAHSLDSLCEVLTGAVNTSFRLQRSGVLQPLRSAQVGLLDERLAQHLCFSLHLHFRVDVGARQGLAGEDSVLSAFTEALESLGVSVTVEQAQSRRVQLMIQAPVSRVAGIQKLVLERARLQQKLVEQHAQHVRKAQVKLASAPAWLQIEQELKRTTQEIARLQGILADLHRQARAMQEAALTQAPGHRELSVRSRLKEIEQLLGGRS